MKIVVKESRDRSIRLHLPNGLAMNSMSAAILSAKLRKKKVNISGKQLHLLFKAAKRYKSRHPEWKLVEVESADGETVEIVL